MDEYLNSLSYYPDSQSRSSWCAAHSLSLLSTHSHPTPPPSAQHKSSPLPNTTNPTQKSQSSPEPQLHNSILQPDRVRSPEKPHRSDKRCPRQSDIIYRFLIPAEVEGPLADIWDQGGQRSRGGEPRQLCSWTILLALRLTQSTRTRLKYCMFEGIFSIVSRCFFYSSIRAVSSLEIKVSTRVILNNDWHFA